METNAKNREIERLRAIAVIMVTVAHGIMTFLFLAIYYGGNFNSPINTLQYMLIWVGMLIVSEVAFRLLEKQFMNLGHAYIQYNYKIS